MRPDPVFGLTRDGHPTPASARLDVAPTYDIHEHSHRFAAWAAATGASASPTCRFSVEIGRAILEATGFTPLLSNPSNMPSPKAFDRVHRKWRLKVITEAKKRKLKFTHGIAAKLINLYLKTRFTLGGHSNHPRVKAIHPPIDSLLIKSVNSTLPRTERMPTAWSKFDDETYQGVIAVLRHRNGNKPFWKIEAHWEGHR